MFFIHSFNANSPKVRLRKYGRSKANRSKKKLRFRQNQKLRYEENGDFSSKLPLYAIKSLCFYWIH